MKVYFDMCSLQRPLDDKAQLRLLVEVQAVLGVLALCESGEVELVASDALQFEAEANPDALRRDFVMQTLAKASHFADLDDEIEDRARKFIGEGIKPLDALHLASAISAQADYLCTCDDRFLKKARTLNTSPTKIVLPLELVSELQI